MSDEYEVPTVMAKAKGADRSDSATVGITPEEMAIRTAAGERVLKDPRAQKILADYEYEKAKEVEWLTDTIRPYNRAIVEAYADHERRLQELEAESDKAMRERWDEIEAEIRAQGVTPQGGE